MVDSAKGITNLHVPNDVIVDASMPAMIRDCGKMWGADGKLQDTKAVIPDGSYARIYQEMIDFCKKHGAFDPRTMGTVPNVGLMAQKAEEYGSHDKTFESAEATARSASSARRARPCWRRTSRTATSGACARSRTRRSATGSSSPSPGRKRPARRRSSGSTRTGRTTHELIKKVKTYLKDHDTTGLDIQIMSPAEATRLSLERIKEGQDTISVTGNVLRDYLTDLFPILELGTSAKMLSIVPLMNGGGLFETGAGGSAPKHVQQLSGRRLPALGFARRIPGAGRVAGAPRQDRQQARAKLLAETLDRATGKLLDNNKSPGRKLGELDNRGSQFYLAIYWAQALAAQTQDKDLQARFSKIAKEMEQNEQKILAELKAAQGKPVDLGGYYHSDPEKTTKAMRPSPTLNAIVDAIK
ncbi:MAG: NADP-dependent isocitrate dehydrogenase [Candidatus Manganitrophus sp.]|nr:NADP-dependent isocitrate dehydrogenase [Candidatus Manganitrophus sp.]